MSVRSRFDPANCGTERLLRDCALVGRMIEAGRRPARLRLAEKVGPELAWLLVAPPPRPSAPGAA
jgi:hypothetical protein